MSVNIYDTANQLERDLRQHDFFVDLKTKIEQVRQDEEANQLFQAFHQMNVDFRNKQMQGIEITEEELKGAQQLAERAQANPLILAVMQAERQLDQLLHDMNRILTQPVMDLYTKG